MRSVCKIKCSTNEQEYFGGTYRYRHEGMYWFVVLCKIDGANHMELKDSFDFEVEVYLSGPIFNLSCKFQTIDK